MGGDSKGGDQTTSQTVEIPEFLRPFIEQGANIGGGALGNIEGLLPSGTNLIEGMNPTQMEALNRSEAVARGGGGFLPTAENTLLSTARGDFLHGGAGFNEAVAAATRAATPGILSAFGRAGRGVSGLSQQAIGQASSDAFARLFNDERGRQMHAAAALPNVGLAGANILSRTGAQRQQQAQAQREGPLAAQERLFSNALRVTGAQAPLFGQTTTAPSQGGSKAGDVLGGGLSIAGLATGGGASLGGGLLSSLLLG